MYSQRGPIVTYDGGRGEEAGRRGGGKGRMQLLEGWITPELFGIVWILILFKDAIFEDAILNGDKEKIDSYEWI
jgi:hypothetical protein